MIADEKRRVALSLNKDVAEELTRLSKKIGLSKSGLITVWINDAVRKENEQKK